jgi:hypothetical protein
VARSKLKVLRIASVTDDLVCDELHQTGPSSVTAGRGVASDLLVFGPGLPQRHVLFELGSDGASYTLVLPPQVTGVLKLRGKPLRVAELWKKQARRDPRALSVRLPLDATAKGKLVLGETALLFQFAPPAPPPPRDPFPLEYRAKMFAGLTRFDLATLLSGLMLLGPYFIWAATRPIDPTIEHEIDERFLRVMGIPPKKEKEPEPEKKTDEEEEQLLAQKDEKKEKDPEIVEKMISPSKQFSDKALAKARGVGVARVLGTYGGPGQGTVFDVIQSTENNLGELFAAGMTRVVEADGTEVSTFVPGGEGISALGAAVATKGFDVTDGPEVAALDKKERKVSLRSSGAEIDGDADKKAIQATIRNRMSALQSCYEKALRGNTGLTGKIAYTITVSVMGTVTAVVVGDDTLQDEGVKTCTVAKIKGWRFPTTPGAEASSDVSFSVVFSGQ